ncbi:C1 [Banana bunchy top alphasatellite 1]|uniref:C1 n=1 Tax=Banana bunchy top alphasatellite 1 TaxID=2169721 RepID=Q83033_9VIRU|nr:C1 [Banana bunchy top alphasatellite 1]AAA51429.1 C1 [Banana bunchy top alphasatellite 1]prf//2122372H ORF C1 [Banana bunchy top virus]
MGLRPNKRFINYNDFLMHLMIACSASYRVGSTCFLIACGGSFLSQQLIIFILSSEILQ